MEQKFCQSCGMPLNDIAVLGTEADGSKNEEYCCYCYANGHFTADCTMDEMINHCAQFVDEFNKDSEIKMTKEEAHWCNLYGAETARVIGEHWSDIKEKAGTQHLDGIHGVAYARIRYTSGNDFKRAQRQRIVLEKVAKKAQKANFITLNKIVNEVFPMISTSFSSKQILGFAANALNYNLVSTNGFPYQVTTSETVKNHSGVSFVIPIGLEQNVKQLHQELFNDDSYEASDKVKEIDSDIVYLTDITADNTEAMESTFKGDSLNEGTE